MFKIGLSDNYRWPVKVVVPTDDGKTLTQDFTAVFKRITQTQVEAFTADLIAAKITDKDIVKQVLIGWQNIVDDNGNQVPFSETLRDQILDGAGIATQIGAIFLDSFRTGREKN